MTIIKAPFNFVPLVNRVFCPEWAQYISHDIPFKDRICGNIKLKIKADTPIFVRNGYTEDEQAAAVAYVKGVYKRVLNEIAETEEIKKKLDKFRLRVRNEKEIEKEKQKLVIQKLKEEAGKNIDGGWLRKIRSGLDEQADKYPYLHFSNINKEYFIPATTLKGCLRSVLEILSFGKYRINQFYDFSSVKKKDFYSYLDDVYKNSSFDLADCIFGSAQAGKALKGRVQISHARCCNLEEVESCSVVMLSMGKPKPSYYPIYLEQPNIERIGVVKRYVDYECDKKEIHLKGWKRYVIHRNFNESKIGIYNKAEDIKHAVLFKPIKNAEFESLIRFHNLKEEELAALISALTFHNHSQCKHSLGLAKPLGYGAISINIMEIVLNEKIIKDNEVPEFVETYCTLFQGLMEKEIGKEWERSANVGELIAIATGTNKEQLLGYMPVFQFAKVKEEKEFLDSFSTLEHKKKINYPSFVAGKDEISPEKIQELKNKMFETGELAGLTKENFTETHNYKIIYIGGKKVVIKNTDTEV